MIGFHFGRSWAGTLLEDECPCPKAACGLVSYYVPECDQHNPDQAKTIRQMHPASMCPANKEES